MVVNMEHVNDDASTMEVNRQERNGVEQPVELESKVQMLPGIIDL